MQVAILLYDGVTALDAVGPFDVLSRIPGSTVVFVAAEPGPKRTEQDHPLTLVADHTLDDVSSPDFLPVPGGFGVDEAIGNERVLAWIRSAHERSR